MTKTDQQVVENAPAHLPEIRNEPASMLEVISRAASDPSVDVGKLERLLEVGRSIEADKARGSFTRALMKLQPMLPKIKERGKVRNKSGGVQSTYALWEDICDTIMPIVNGCGFTLTFRTPPSSEVGFVTVTGILAHKAGHFQESTITLPVDTSGNKNAVQAVGSSKSYGKRYTAQDLLNLTSTASQDDDGKAAGDGPTITETEAENFIEQLEAIGGDRKKFAKYMGVETIHEIPQAQLSAAKQALAAFKAKQEKTT